MSGAIDRFMRGGARAGLHPEVRRFPEGTKTADDAAARDRMRRRPDREVAGLHGRATGAGAGAHVAAPTGSTRPSWPRSSGAGVGPAGHARGGAGRDRVRRGRHAAVRPSRSAVTTFVDRDLLGYDEIWAAAGTPDSVFPLTPADLLRVSGATVADVRRGSEVSRDAPGGLSSRSPPIRRPSTPEEPMITLTENAAGKVKELLVEEGRDDIALRVAVQPGGCSGPPVRDVPGRPGDARRTTTDGAVRRPARDRQDERAVPVAGHDRLRGHAGAVGVHDRQPRRPGRLRLRQLVPLSPGRPQSCAVDLAPLGDGVRARRGTRRRARRGRRRR